MRQLFIFFFYFISTTLVIGQVDKLTIEDLKKSEDQSLLDVDVTTASKSSESLKNAPGIVSVITATEIEKFGATNLLEVIERVASTYSIGTFYVPQNYVSIRGDLSSEYNNHVLTLINGRPSRESLLGGVDFSIFYGIPLSSIERIEVIRGPGSVLYGSNAYSGIVNIITNDIQKDNTSLSASYGSFDTYQLEVNNSKLKDDLKLKTSFKYSTSEGWPVETIGEFGDTLQYNASENSIGGLVSANYKDFTLSALLTYSNQDHLGVLPVLNYPPPGSTPREIRNRQIESLRTFIDFGYQFKFSEKTHLNANLTYNGQLTRFSTPSGDAITRTRDALFEVTKFYSPTNNLNILVGGTAYLQSGSAETGDDEGRGVEEFNETWYNAYTQIDYTPFAALKLIGGIQLNKPAGVDLDIVPRLGAIYNFTDRLGLKLLYGQAFRAAFEAENSLVDIPVLIGNPDLTPEKVETVDMQAFYYSSKLQLGATLFRSVQRDLISRSTVTVLLGTEEFPVSSFENRNEQILQGLELEAKYNPNSKWFFNGAFTYQTNELNDSISNYTLAPQVMLKLGVFYQFKNKSSVGVFNSYFGKSEVLTTTNNVNPAAEAFHYLNAKAYIELSKLLKLDSSNKLGFSIMIVNLLDEEIYYPEYVRRVINTIPGRPGRAFYGSLSFRF